MINKQLERTRFFSDRVQIAYTAIPGIRRLEMGAKASRIIQSVCEHYGIAEKKIYMRSRRRAICEPRQVAMFLLREAGLTLGEVGSRLKGYDHTSVIHSVARIKDLIEIGDRVKYDVERIRERVGI